MVLDGSTPLENTAQLDELGRVVEEQVAQAGRSETRRYRYRTNGELERAEVVGGSATVYGYDAHGNRVSVAGPGGTRTAQYDERDRLIALDGETYAYDGLGHLSSRTEGATVWRYDHDFEGRLKRVEGPGGLDIRYRLDGFGRRAQRIEGGDATATYLYAGGSLTYLVAADGTVTRFVYGHHPHVPAAMERAGVWYRIASDLRGSVRAVLEAQTGVVVQELSYGPFGEVERDTNPGFQPFGFAGGMYEPSTGLVHFGAREYLPEAGVWLTPDPLGFAAGDTALYRYVFNDPVNLTDPSGNLAFAPVMMGAFLAYKVASGAMTIADLYYAAKDLLDPCVSDGDKMKRLAEMFGDALTGFLVGKGVGALAKKAGQWVKKFLCKSSFVAGTLVAVPGAAVAVPIETLEVGDRVQTVAGGSSTEATEVDATWKVVRLETESSPSQKLTLLRPPAWLEAQEVAEGVRIFLDGEAEPVPARVVSVSAFSGPKPGPGRVVLATIESESEDVYTVSLADEPATRSLPALRGTGNHPVYSLDRGDWVEVQHLEVGERLQTAEAAVRVAALARERDAQPVYNLEVEGDHEYLAGNQWVRVHNCKAAPGVPGNPYSPQEVSHRQSELRRQLQVNPDPKTPIPDQGPGANIKGAHSSPGKEAHRPGQRNIAGKGMEEHNVKPPGRGGRGPGRK